MVNLSVAVFNLARLCRVVQSSLVVLVVLALLGIFMDVNGLLFPSLLFLLLCLVVAMVALLVLFGGYGRWDEVRLVCCFKMLRESQLRAEVDVRVLAEWAFEKIRARIGRISQRRLAADRTLGTLPLLLEPVGETVDVKDVVAGKQEHGLGLLLLEVFQAD